MSKDTVSPEAMKLHSQAYERYLKDGNPPAVAEEMADMYLLEWDQPLPLPAAPAEAWD